MAPNKIQRSTDRDPPPIQEPVELGPAATADNDPGLTASEGGDKPVRMARVPFGGPEFKMNATPQEGYHLHWFNDRPGRIDRAKRAGYEHILDERGAPVSMVVDSTPGTGGLLAYAMEIPNDLWLEDMKARNKKVDEIEDSIKRGTFGQKQGDGRYVPQNAIRISHGTRR